MRLLFFFTTNAHIIAKKFVILHIENNNYATMSSKNKDGRLEIIKMIVSQQEVGSQEELRAELHKYGYESTQTTLSRDLKQLKIVKSTNADGNYVYLLPHVNAYHRVSELHPSMEGMRRFGVSSVRFSGNMAVVRTLPGHAAHVALEIDQLDAPEIMGTVAGDDTIFIVMNEDAERIELLNRLSQAGIYNKENEKRFY